MRPSAPGVGWYQLSCEQKNLTRKFGSLGKIRTSNPSVNSGWVGKSKCRVWCRLQKNGAIFPLLVAPNVAPKMAVQNGQRIRALTPIVVASLLFCETLGNLRTPDILVRS